MTTSKLVCGIDEVGRGALAGPVVAASVIFNNYSNIPLNIRDSKKIDLNKRSQLFKNISKVAKVGIGVVSSNTIDLIGISRATNLAAIKSFRNIKCKVFKILSDGDIKFYTKTNIINLTKGDSNYVSIAAASIIAKVTRDKIMKEYGQIYRNYNWKKNMGYGTKEHLLAIKNYGISEIHRKTFKVRI